MWNFWFFLLVGHCCCFRRYKSYRRHVLLSRRSERLRQLCTSKSHYESLMSSLKLFGNSGDGIVRLGQFGVHEGVPLNCQQIIAKQKCKWRRLRYLVCTCLCEGSYRLEQVRLSTLFGSSLQRHRIRWLLSFLSPCTCWLWAQFRVRVCWLSSFLLVPCIVTCLFPILAAIFCLAAGSRSIECNAMRLRRRPQSAARMQSKIFTSATNSSEARFETFEHGNQRLPVCPCCVLPWHVARRNLYWAQFLSISSRLFMAVRFCESAVRRCGSAAHADHFFLN